MKFWKGTMPRDLAANPTLLAKMASYYEAAWFFVDSLKDAAVRLTEDGRGAIQPGEATCSGARDPGANCTHTIKRGRGRTHRLGRRYLRIYVADLWGRVSDPAPTGEPGSHRRFPACEATCRRWGLHALARPHPRHAQCRVQAWTWWRWSAMPQGFTG